MVKSPAWISRSPGGTTSPLCSSWVSLISTMRMVEVLPSRSTLLRFFVGFGPSPFEGLVDVGLDPPPKLLFQFRHVLGQTDCPRLFSQRPCPEAPCKFP